MINNAHTLAVDFLGKLEESEASLLSWGLVDGFWSEDELFEKADAFVSERDAFHIVPDGRALVSVMEEDHFVIRWGHPSGYRYRTRMAESLRMMSRLRQLFPKHLRTPGAWITSPSLVSDFRFLPRSRSYPRRNVNAAKFVDSLAVEWPGSGISAMQREIARSILGITASNEGENYLAGFQVRATERILQCAKEGSIQRSSSFDEISGTVICSGTGSGKTLGFYLPALVHLAGMLERNSEPWTRALAIYPRNELLKDQFSEVASRLGRVNGTLGRYHKRGLRIGAFFGDTPKDNLHFDAQEGRRPAWARHGSGWICPFLRCTTDNCDGQMVWLDADRLQGVEKLSCSRCHALVDERTIVLTRKRMRDEPPDILFTSTEMLNQRMTDSRLWHLFGIGHRAPSDKKPAFVLLDEAHTYVGSSGAQAAMLIRRWRHRANCSPHFTGLSATLMEAVPFFSQLTGVPENRVEQVTPETGEMLEEGREYLVALRGDPASGASLLSTTIQLAMLWRRVLDPNPPVTVGGTEQNPSIFGRKAFVFTDDLDVTNRLYFNLLDAEGLDHLGRPDFVFHPDGSLANLRSGNLPERDRRWLHGQWWQLCEEIGHPLQTGQTIRIGRVSSQDAGVDSEAELIVATAALEVGFNDPDVGAVIQHKAPREASAFLQRKGRAGRRREIRPWTLVVLSDFGRDRLAYQGYDALFDPELRPRRLPLANRHILKMQAVYSCLDWLAAQLSSGGNGHVWAEASAPASYDAARRRQEQGSVLLQDVLACGDSFFRLQDWVRRSLRLPDGQEVDALLWESPRGLMTEVIPTLLRRWETQWQSGIQKEAEHHAFWHPLPEFIPANLFSDLNLPEVTIWAALRPGSEPDPFELPATQAIREFSPGRISRRFGIRHRLSRHWIPLSLNIHDNQDVDVDTFCPATEREELGVFSIRTGKGQFTPIRVLRPFGMYVKHDAPPDVLDSSNAIPVWRSQLIAPQGGITTGLIISLPTASPWRNVIREISFFTHREQQPVQIRRFSLGSLANIRLKDGTAIDVKARFVCPAPTGGAIEPVALGYAFETDAVRVRLAIPQDWKFSGSNIAPQKLQSLRVQRFRWQVDTNESLGLHASFFQREWLSEITLAALGTVAIETQQTLEAAWSAIKAKTASISLSDVLKVIFQSLPIAPHGDNDEAVQFEQRRMTELRDLLNVPEVLDALDHAVSILWSNPDAGWNDWLREKYLATMGAAFREAVQQVCPDENVDSDLIVDLDAGPLGNETPQGCADFWLSETAPGGGGLIEHLLPKIVDDPRRFLDLVECSLDASDYEFVDGELRRFLVLADDSKLNISSLVGGVRSSVSQEQLTTAFLALKTALGKAGIQVSHSVMSALSSRVLRPGSSNATDKLLSNLLERWGNEEKRLGIEIEMRSFAYALSLEDDLDVALSAGASLPFGPGQDRRQWRCNTLSSMLWPRGMQARNHSLSLWNPYAPTPPTERWLVKDQLDHTEEIVDFGVPSWISELSLALQRGGRAILKSQSAKVESFREALLGLLATPVDTGTLLLYPRLRGARRESDEVHVIFELTTPTLMGPPEVSQTEAGDKARIVVKTSQGNRDEIRDLLESLFIAELLAPGPEIWLVSPWVSDLDLLDNRSGAYSALDPYWPKRFLTLAELLAFALKTNPNTKLRVVTRSDQHNTKFCERLRRLTELEGTNNRLFIASDKDTLHSKGLVGTAFAMNGSMNFTRNGVSVFDETVQFETAPDRLAQLRINFQHNYPFAPEL